MCAGHRAWIALSRIGSRHDRLVDGCIARDGGWAPSILAIATFVAGAFRATAPLGSRSTRCRSGSGRCSCRLGSTLPFRRSCGGTIPLGVPGRWCQAVAEEAVDANVHLAMSLRNSGFGDRGDPRVASRIGGPRESHDTPNSIRSVRRCATSTCPVATSAFGKPRSVNPKRSRLRRPHRGCQRSARSRSRCTIPITRAANTRSGRFALSPIGETRWLCSMVRHWNLDRPDPRDPPSAPEPVP